MFSQTTSKCLIILPLSKCNPCSRHETPVLSKTIDVIHCSEELVVLDKPCSLPVCTFYFRFVNHHIFILYLNLPCRMNTVITLPSLPPIKAFHLLESILACLHFWMNREKQNLPYPTLSISSSSQQDKDFIFTFSELLIMSGYQKSKDLRISHILLSWTNMAQAPLNHI